MKERYFVMTQGRGSSDYPEMHPHDGVSLTMDVRGPRGRRPMTLIEAKQRAGHVAGNEENVTAFVCRVEYIAERRPHPVILRKVNDNG